MKNLFLCALALFAPLTCHRNALADSADEIIKEVGVSIRGAEKPRLQANQDGATWRVFERDCSFLVFYRDKTKTLNTALAMNENDCQAIANTKYHVLKGGVLVADWASERGGYAVILHAGQKKIAWRAIRYESSDDSEFIARREGSRVLIATDQTRAKIGLLKNGKPSVIRVTPLDSKDGG